MSRVRLGACLPGRLARPRAAAGGRATTPLASIPVLRVRWLGRVRYGDALAVQRALHGGRGGDDHLLLMEHPHVFTLGVRGRPEDVLVDAATVGAEVVRADRGGQVTYHGPGQLVGYPIVSVPGGPGSVPAHMAAIEQVVIDALADLGLGGCGRLGRPCLLYTSPSPRDS